MPNPFRLFFRLAIALFRITGYLVSYSIQALWALLYRRPDRVGDAIGELGAAITDALADVFKD